MMPKAIWNGAVIADAKDDEVEIVEGNVYFSPASVNQNNLRASDKVTTCPWKGMANYYDVVIGSEVNKDAAWTYRAPKEAAKNIAGRIAFWRGVEVEK
jgi:uncharacterized protein (DUF427 family)